MRLGWLHRDRAEVLTALALVAEQGDDLHAGFARLAADDPTLRQWIDRLAPLRGDDDPAGWLYRCRLVDADQRAYLAERGGRARLGRALANCARGSRRLTPGFALVRWFPVWLMAVLLPLPVVVATGVEALSDSAFSRIYEELGIGLSGLSHLLFDVAPTQRWLVALVLPAALAVVLAVVLRIPWVPVACSLWGTGVWLAAATRRLVHVAECGSWAARSSATRLGDAVARVLHLGGDPDRRWLQDWRVFRALTVFKVPRDRRMAGDLLAGELGLLGRLRVLGLVPVSGEAEGDWDEAIDQADRRYRAAYERHAPWLRAVLALAAVYACYVGLLAPMVELINLMTWRGGWSIGPESTVLWVASTFVAGLVLAALGSLRWPPSLVFTAWGFDPGATRRVCRALASALRHGSDVQAALESLYPELPLVYRFRIQAAVRRLTLEGGPIARILREELVVPPAVAEGLAAAEGISHHELRRHAEWEAGRGEGGGGGSRGLVTVGYALLFMGLLAWLSVFILPMYDKLLHELGLELPTSTTSLLAVVGHPWTPWLLALVVVGGPVGWALWRWLWLGAARGPQRLRRGWLAVAGARAGLDERRIVAELAATWRRPPQALHAAGMRGDFAAVAAACGWRADDPAGLSEALDRSEWRRSRWRALQRALSMVMLPVVLAVPTLWLCLAMFQPLVLVVVRLGEESL